MLCVISSAVACLAVFTVEITVEIVVAFIVLFALILESVTGTVGRKHPVQNPQKKVTPSKGATQNAAKTERRYICMSTCIPIFLDVLATILLV